MRTWGSRCMNQSIGRKAPSMPRATTCFSSTGLRGTRCQRRCSTWRFQLLWRKRRCRQPFRTHMQNVLRLSHKLSEPEAENLHLAKALWESEGGCLHICLFFGRLPARSPEGQSSKQRWPQRARGGEILETGCPIGLGVATSSRRVAQPGPEGRTPRQRRRGQESGIPRPWRPKASRGWPERARTSEILETGGPSGPGEYYLGFSEGCNRKLGFAQSLFGGRKPET